jgi:hypothetical protein
MTGTALPQPSLRQRFGSLMLVVLLHALLLLAALHAVSRHAAPFAPRETLLRLLPLFKPPPPPPMPRVQAAPAPRAAVRPIVPPPPTAAPAPSLQGLGQALFGCAPENLVNLTPDQRAHCTGIITRPDDSVAVPPANVRSARGASDTKPLVGRIPCTYITSAPAAHGSAPAPMLDLWCLTKALAK